MATRLILVPYHLGRKRVGLGRGPEAIARTLPPSATAATPPACETVELPQQGWRGELAAVARVNRAVAGLVHSALSGRQFPLVLAGDCNVSLGVLAGLAHRSVGVVWLDAHGDFNTPDSSPSGYLDGMALAIATGLCHPALLAGIGAPAVAGGRVIHLGGRDFDPGELERMAASQVRTVPAAALRAGPVAVALGPALSELRSIFREVYLLLDLDVLDPEVAPANRFSGPGGLSLVRLEELLRFLAGRFAIRAAALTAYDPGCDRRGLARDAAARLIRVLTDLAR